MPKRANPGRMNTRIRILTPEDGIDSSGNQLRTYHESPIIYAYWENRQLSNTHGYEAVTAEELYTQLWVRLTLRYHRGLMPDCMIKRETDGTVWRILSINDWEQRHKWQELRLEKQEKTV